MEPTIIFDNISKKFSQNYISDSLRDALVQPFKKLFRKGNKNRKSGKEFWALKNVNFDVKPGEVLGIIGPNGSGKTTSLKLLSRILRPDSGKIVVHGRIGSLIELAAGINPEFSGRENIFLNGSILGMNTSEIKEKYDEIVDFAELHEFMETPVKWYSSGMLARLAFSVAAHTEPDVLLVDEILSVGDMVFQEKCFNLMKSFKDQGTTLVFVSHNLPAVSSLCDRAVLLSGGTILCEGSPEEVIGQYLDTTSPLNTGPGNDGFIEIKKGILQDRKGNDKTTFKVGERGRICIEIFFTEDFPPNLYCINNKD